MSLKRCAGIQKRLNETLELPPVQTRFNAAPDVGRRPPAGVHDANCLIRLDEGRNRSAEADRLISGLQNGKKHNPTGNGSPPANAIETLATTVSEVVEEADGKTKPDDRRSHAVSYCLNCTGALIRRKAGAQPRGLYQRNKYNWYMGRHAIW